MLLGIKNWLNFQEFTFKFNLAFYCVGAKFAKRRKKLGDVFFSAQRETVIRCTDWSQWVICFMIFYSPVEILYCGLIDNFDLLLRLGLIVFFSKS